jgi:anti-sigma-K factor RskA
LVFATREIAPPPTLWRDIEARIAKEAHTARNPSARPARARRSTEASPWWDSLAFWRNWGLAATGCALALAVASAIRPPVVQTVEVESKHMQPSYIATLDDGKGNIVFMAYAGRSSDELWIKQVAMQPLPVDRSYELWGLSQKPGIAPRSLGVVPPGEKSTIKLAEIADKSLVGFQRLAISVEPAGGSKTGQPSGPVVYQGHCHKFW